MRAPEGLTDRLLNAYIGAIPLIMLNIVWIVFCLPILTIFPATGALFYAMNRLAHNKPAEFSTFWEGFRTYGWLSVRWGLLTVAVLAVLVGNVLFYGQYTGDWVIWVRGVFIALIAFWLIIQMLTFPLLLEQEAPRIGLAMRNALVILIRRPLFVVGQAFIIGLIVGFSLFVIGPAWVLITGSLCAYLANRAVVDSITRLTGRTADSGTE